MAHCTITKVLYAFKIDFQFISNKCDVHFPWTKYRHETIDIIFYRCFLIRFLKITPDKNHLFRRYYLLFYCYIPVHSYIY